MAGGEAKYVEKPVPDTVEDALRVVNAPVLAVVPPMAGGEAKYVEKPVPDTVEDALRVVNAPVLAVVAPIVVPLIEPLVIATESIASTKFVPSQYTSFLAPALRDTPVPPEAIKLRVAFELLYTI
jgi:hypothetical protein